MIEEPPNQFRREVRDGQLIILFPEFGAGERDQQLEGIADRFFGKTALGTHPFLESAEFDSERARQHHRHG